MRLALFLLNPTAIAPASITCHFRPIKLRAPPGRRSWPVGVCGEVSTVEPELAAESDWAELQRPESSSLDQVQRGAAGE